MGDPRPLHRNRDFMLFTAGQTTSAVGTGLLQLAVLLHVYGVTHSTRMTTLTFLIETAPLVLLSPWAGVLADRVDRRRILIAADLGRTLLLIPLLVTTRLAVLLPVLGALSMVACVFRPAEGALLPAVVPQAQLTRANSFTSASYAVLALVCPPLGGALFAAYGFPVIVVVDMASFVVSVVTLGCMRARSQPREASTEHTSPVRDLVAGLRLARQLPALRLLLGTGLCFALMEAFVHPMFIPFVQGTLHATAPEVGFAMTAQAIGVLACGLIVTAISHRLSAPRMFAVGSVGLAFAAALFALAPTYPVAVVALGVMGIPAVIENVGIQTLMQTEVPDHARGRALGFMATAYGGAAILGAAVPAFAAGLIGVRGLILCSAAVTCLGAVLAVVGLRWFRADAATADDVPEDTATGPLAAPAPDAAVA